MKRYYRLHIAGKEIGVGVLDVDRNGKAFFWSAPDAGARTLGSLERCRLLVHPSNGMLLSGMEPDGFDQKGAKKFKYREWWLTFCESPEEESLEVE